MEQFRRLLPAQTTALRNGAWTPLDVQVKKTVETCVYTCM